MNTTTNYHVPVLLDESIKQLAIQPDGIYIDATLGGGGHAKAILTQLTTGHLYAFDKDPDTLATAQRLASPCFTYIPADFRFIKQFLHYKKVKQVHGILADLGTSSHQINTSTRGFSTRFEGPLDMRMNPATQLTAATLLATYTVKQLTTVLRTYGNVQHAHKLAISIVKARQKKPLSTTADLNKILLPFAPKNRIAKYQAKVFQALRIIVNDELGALQTLLEATPDLLMPQGRLVILSYHALEDRLVKRFMRTGNWEGHAEKDIYGNLLRPLQPLTRKAVKPTQAEIATNKRARSAKLRAALCMPVAKKLFQS